MIYFHEWIHWASSSSWPYNGFILYPSTETIPMKALHDLISTKSAGWSFFLSYQIPPPLWNLRFGFHNIILHWFSLPLHRTVPILVLFLVFLYWFPSIGIAPSILGPLNRPISLVTPLLLSTFPHFHHPCLGRTTPLKQGQNGFSAWVHLGQFEDRHGVGRGCDMGQTRASLFVTVFHSGKNCPSLLWLLKI